MLLSTMQFEGFGKIFQIIKGVQHLYLGFEIVRSE